MTLSGEVTDGNVVKAGVSVTWNVVSWSGGHESESQSGRNWGAWYFCPKSYLNQNIYSVNVIRFPHEWYAHNQIHVMVRLGDLAQKHFFKRYFFNCNINVPAGISDPENLDKETKIDFLSQFNIKEAMGYWRSWSFCSDAMAILLFWVKTVSILLCFAFAGGVEGRRVGGGGVGVKIHAYTIPYTIDYSEWQSSIHSLCIEST